MSYRQYRHYSAYDDAYMVRLSMWDSERREFYCFIPWNKGGRVFRENRDVALASISEAIRTRQEPGEIAVGTEC